MSAVRDVLTPGADETALAAERAVLGAILLHGDKFAVAAAVLGAHDFFRDAHQRIFAAMGRLVARAQPIEFITLRNELDRAGDTEKVDGPAYLTKLVDGVPRSTNVEHYARLVKHRALARTLIGHARYAIETFSKDPDALGNGRGSQFVAAVQRVVDAAHVGAPATRDFCAVGDGRYTMSLLQPGIEFEIDRLRRDRHELFGELSVRCDLAGARTIDGTLSTADFNLSSARARHERGKLLADRAKAPDLDWDGFLEEFCLKVLAAERAGQPATVLSELPRPVPSEEFDVDGIRLLRDHPVICFGDGGDGKSYLGLYCGGELARRGLTVLYADWELGEDDHRDRLERLYGPDMPRVLYARCDRPMTVEADRLGRLVRQHGVDYLINDSVAFACDGPPEAAEVASDYFRALRQIRCGSLNLAHTNRSETSDQKPFGSAFWHNGARATWYIKRAATSSDGQRLNIGLFNRKANLGPLRPAIGFEVAFDAERTWFRRIDVGDVDDLAASLPIWQRMRHALKSGPMTIAALAEQLQVKVDSVDKSARRLQGKAFTRVAGDDGVYRIALIERGAV